VKIRVLWPGEFCLQLVLFLCAVFLSSSAQTVPCAATIQKQGPPNAVVDVSLNKTRIHPGEPVFVTFRITNCGSFPFYIPHSIADIEWHGGFQDIVTGPRNAKVAHSVAAGDYGPDYHPDILKEVEDSWILLQPGQFYGGTVPLNTVPGSPGTWTIIARRNPPRVTGELQEKMHKSLKFPVLLDKVDSKPIYLEVVE
jgi:hypothetical protein